MNIYPTEEISWQVTMIGAVSIGILIGAVVAGLICFFLGKKAGRKDEPRAWTQLRYFKGQAEKYGSKALLYKSVLKTVQMAVAIPEISEEDD